MVSFGIKTLVKSVRSKFFDDMANEQKKFVDKVGEVKKIYVSKDLKKEKMICCVFDEDKLLICNKDVDNPYEACTKEKCNMKDCEDIDVMLLTLFSMFKPEECETVINALNGDQVKVVELPDADDYDEEKNEKVIWNGKEIKVVSMDEDSDGD